MHNPQSLLTAGLDRNTIRFTKIGTKVVSQIWRLFLFRLADRKCSFILSMDKTKVKETHENK